MEIPEQHGFRILPRELFPTFVSVNLIIDQGNTQTKLALFERDELVEKAVFPSTDPEAVIQWADTRTKGSADVLISSVIKQSINLDSRNLLRLTPQTPLPLVNTYHSPETLGNDRLANAVAAWIKNPGKNSLVIDMGTCIKYDLVNAKGEYLGGIISPGMRMRYSALHQLTGQLPELEYTDKRQSYGTDTASSITEGVQQGIEHEINGFVERYAIAFTGLTIFMTGGDLNSFDLAFKSPIFADSDLTLFGLNEILKYNVQS